MREEISILFGIEHILYLLNNSKCSNKNLGWKVIILRPLQWKCLKFAAEQNDTIVCLPTGYGKSFLFEVLPYLEKGFSKRESSVVLVVMPFNAIIDNQMHKLGENCMKLWLTMSSWYLVRNIFWVIKKLYQTIARTVFCRHYRSTLLG